MNVARVYRNAVIVLKPSKARMARVMAEGAALHAQAKKIVAEQLATGRTARELYDAACAVRTRFDSKLEREIRVTLLGLVRREA
ncbi:hypothetical protein PHIM7_288 [Sinorhizobium phage phiM7]|uniref:Uncharacterized protein n=2 Tax=Emdodecavirus TaxID=1980937 RepID=S5MVU3_9CAUD|nr:hypothetical protein AB690_gp221 [Sinorhizobium phage phiM12]YP_009601413.1 hypothetical protein FDH46_gp190 [Sinorhizobium phage phiM7]AGR48007.1 hypothetical protein SmphiM12_375 [Sinorhizobium phage phiM12]AKF12833.1 hypothetical protein PHIM7_288 [Sinorhizobium phage phiM7]AKF13193.1 hypothetical protein PHIM19_288 [Sinorhizobium phage phiM19]